MSISLWFLFSPNVNIWSGGRPPPSWTGCGPPDADSFANIFYWFQKYSLWSFRSFRDLLFLHKNSVSPGQIMQVRVQNKGKSVWKSRYDGDISTPPRLNHCLPSSNSVDKLKVIKKNFYRLCLILLLQICKANIQVFSKGYELTIFTITLRSHVYSYQ